MFEKVLVANRGEIAVRVMRTVHELGAEAVAVFSDADRDALHVRLADEAVHVGPALVAESYLRVEKIIDAAKKTGAQAIHPGYGFLSENVQLAQACDDAGIAFVGPPVGAIEKMASKTGARAVMKAAGVPVVPGGRANTLDEAKATAEEVGYPVMIKAVMGGGGKGMRLVGDPAELPRAIERAQSEALAAFGDGTVYIEKAIIEPRHVEIQILGDRQGNVVHLFERDCSIQRRHQKVVEETPCPVATDDLIARMGEVAVKAGEAVGYYSAGTVEFLLDADGSFYFLEMNTRLQVEHPITEWITGRDLVRDMLRVAAGEPLGFTQDEVTRSGASIECRIYAEDPAKNFMPSPGRIDQLVTPNGPFVRDDGGVYSGAEVSSHYDPLISKLSVWAPTRPEALARMRRALREYVVTGIKTNIAFHDRLLQEPAFAEGRYHTGYLAEHPELLQDAPPPERDELAVALAVATAERAQRGAQQTKPQGEGLSPWVSVHRRHTLR